MKLTRRLLLLAAALALAGCAQIATVTEVKPKDDGFAVKSSDPLAGLDSHLGAAGSAWQKLKHDPADRAARGDYNRATGRIFGVLRERKLTPWAGPVKVGPRTLTWRKEARKEWNPALYELIPAGQLKIGGTYLKEREIKAGLGVPLVAKRAADRAHDYAPTPHFFYAATGMVRFEGSRCVLSMEDPIQTENVKVGRAAVPLAADFTAPLAMMLVEMHPKELGKPRLLHPEKFASTTRISRLEPWDPDKTVVLVVHGLMSSPATWIPMLNLLRADEDIRRKFQFWFFSYPTGYPYPYSAAILRRELDAADKNYPSHKKMIVMGHSMGGCISRLLITDSGPHIWDQMFTVPPEQMDLTPEHKHILTESSIFRHRPEIGRVIFISAPLRGAGKAGGWLGSLGSRLIQLPADMLTLGREEAVYQKVAAGHKHLDRFPDSVDTLSPDNDFVKALADVPLVPGIPYHTIAGDRGRGDAPDSSDGLVPYWSSHLPGAASEKIVPSHHNAQQHPVAFEEVHRILQLHSQAK